MRRRFGILGIEETKIIVHMLIRKLIIRNSACYFRIIRDSELDNLANLAKFSQCDLKAEISQL